MYAEGKILSSLSESLSFGRFLFVKTVSYSLGFITG